MKMNEAKQAWSLAEWLHNLEFRQHPEVQLRLINVQQAANLLQVAQWDIPVITVGGTNGKGSTVAALSAIYQAGGYQVGQFTSPHLLRFNERICINQIEIGDAELCRLFLKIDEQCAQIGLTYFEMSFLAALLYFKSAALDLLVLEVGVGGRLDATNIIDADLAIITTVALDHQDYLGHDLESIGFEKAGILRPSRPFIYADYAPPDSVRAHAQALQVEGYYLGQDFDYQNIDEQLVFTQKCSPPIRLPLPKLHPHAAVAAIMASLCLQTRLPVNQDHWIRALAQMKISGRQQYEPGTISFFYDVAHNPQAATLLAQRLQKENVQGNIHAIFSALQDKDLNGLIQPLAEKVTFWYPTSLVSKRATSKERLLTEFEKVLGKQFKCYNHPIEAKQAALQSAQPGDMILVYGSFVLVGEIMASTTFNL